MAAADFTLKMYRRLLQSLLRLDYAVITVAEYLTGRAPEKTKRVLVLRHDVEWNAGQALAMAEVEHALGIRATYYFRADTKAYDVRIMRVLQQMGHEIGYHFNVLDRCRGEYPKAAALFLEELARFRNHGFSVRTVCSHGDPRVPKSGYQVNYDIFRYDPDLMRRAGLLGEAYVSFDFCSLQYISDAGVRWNKAGSTPELLRLLDTERPPLVYLLAHPDYWSSTAVRAFALRNLAKAVRATKVNRAIAGTRKLVRGITVLKRSSTGANS